MIDAVERKLTKPRTVAGWDLPAGINVFPGIALVHRREDLYPGRLEFRPERFLEEGAEVHTRWLPFGGGIRRCVGAALAQAEMIEVLRVIVPAVELRPKRDALDPVVLKGVTLTPRHGVRVAVKATRRVPSAAAPAAAPEPLAGVD